MEEGVRTRLKPSEGRRFAFTVGAAFVVFGGAAYYRGRIPVAATLASIGLLLLFSGLAAPGRLTPVWRAWMGLARAISKITTPVFMGVVYFVVFAPLGLLRRFTGKNSLAHSAGSQGYWVRRDAGKRGKSDLERQF